jgi:adenylate cyclase
MTTQGQGRIERRLAAILAADIAGYSRLMGTDEAGTAAVSGPVTQPRLDGPRVASRADEVIE